MIHTLKYLTLLLTLFVLIGLRATYASELHIAVAKGDLKQVKSLIRSGSALNELSSDPLDTLSSFPKASPLFWAVAYGHNEIVVYLINKGVDVNAATYIGDCSMVSVPLEEALFRKHFNIAKILLVNGANVEGSNHDFFWPLQIAAKNGDIESLKLLLSYGASVDTGGVDGYTALHYAAQEGHIHIAKLLLEKGAKVNECWDSCCITPLQVAIENEQIEMVSMLFQTGADVSLTDCMGKSPLSLATEEILKIFYNR